MGDFTYQTTEQQLSSCKGKLLPPSQDVELKLSEALLQGIKSPEILDSKVLHSSSDYYHPSKSIIFSTHYWSSTNKDKLLGTRTKEPSNQNQS
jgi:hypothetical protein